MWSMADSLTGVTVFYDQAAAAAIHALMEDPGREPLAERLIAALEALNIDPRNERFRRRAYAPTVDWGFLVRTRDDELLILWDWDAEAAVPRVRYVGPDL
jgi:hypothetical protein